MSQADETFDDRPEPQSGEAGSEAPATSRLGIALWSGAGLCLLATGLVLWDARGAVVFTDVLSAAIAWCF